MNAEADRIIRMTWALALELPEKVHADVSPVLRAYASLLDGTHPDMMLVRRDVPSITVQIGHLVLAVGGPLNEIEDGKWTSKPPGRYVRVDGP